MNQTGKLLPLLKSILAFIQIMMLFVLLFEKRFGSFKLQGLKPHTPYPCLKSRGMRRAKALILNSPLRRCET